MMTSFRREPFTQILLIPFLLLLLPSTTCQLPLDALRPNSPIRDGDVVVSGRNIFSLGFFSPGNSKLRYVGVWYNNVPNQTIVWVANRDNPVNDSSGVLSISGDGGLVIHGKDPSTPLWSANVTFSSSPNNSVAKLMDTGNLVLLESESSQTVLWQGFDYPSNILLPYMKLGYNRRSGKNWLLTSWKSQNDPGKGNCSYGISLSGPPQFVLYQGGALRYRTLMGIYAGKIWRGSVTNINNEDEVSVMYVPANESSVLTRTILDESGILERSTWYDRDQKWDMYWSAPIERCDMYGRCGPNSNCNPYLLDAMDCNCLPGYEPKSPSDWYMRDGSGGCVRRKGVKSVCGNGEGFVEVERVKIPDMSKARSFDMNLDLSICEQVCLHNCSCMAYSSSDEGTGCVTWPGDLMDIRTLADAGQGLYVRVDAIVLAQYAKSDNPLGKKGKVMVSLASVLVLFLVFFLVVWLVRKRKGQRRRNEFLFGYSIGSTYSGQSTGRTNVDETRMKPDLPFFDLTTVAAATNNFSIENKLGTGGFGSVYKGVLSNGKEIAVKRLSQSSCQGTEEFKNEVLLISKLQHRNLVRI